MIIYLLSALLLLALINSLIVWLGRNKTGQLTSQIQSLQIRLEERDKNFDQLRSHIIELSQSLQKDQQLSREKFDQHQLHSLKTITESLQKGIFDIRQHVNQTLNDNTTALTKQVEKLTNSTSTHLKEISGQVEKRLSEGFAKTTETFTDVIKRLALIDQAQKKITELSSNVVSLQEVLSDRKARGAFGEIQLSALIRNMLPEQNFSLQHSLSNGKRPDAILFLPEPTGNIAIDAKFPLESYRLLDNHQLTPAERGQLETRFRKDIRHHINEISTKYVIPGETSDGAVMFIPAESVFAEIHAHFPELIDEAHKAQVWMVSPTTMMAILTTARAVLKDAATRKQVHIIQEHLVSLSKDFDRFQKRMDNLAKHIAQVHGDVEDIHKSSRKISSRFSKIEQVELKDEQVALLEEEV